MPALRAPRVSSLTKPGRPAIIVETFTTRSHRAEGVAEVEKVLTNLKKVKLLSGLDRETFEQLATITELRSYKAGQQVYAEGESDAALFIIIGGRIRIDKQVEADHQQTLQQIREGEMLGAISFVLGGEHSVSAQALDDSELLMIRRTEFDKLAARSPAIAYKVMLRLAGQLATLLRTMDDKFVEMIGYIYGRSKK
jgi:CRP-like cAMP-binding protein